jgi:hypothetical protein
MTKNGKQCNRKVDDGEFCYQHLLSNASKKISVKKASVKKPTAKQATVHNRKKAETKREIIFRKHREGLAKALEGLRDADFGGRTV